MYTRKVSRDKNDLKPKKELMITMFRSADHHELMKLSDL